MTEYKNIPMSCSAHSFHSVRLAQRGPGMAASSQAPGCWQSARCPIFSARAADGVHLNSCEWKTTALAEPVISGPSSLSWGIPVTVIGLWITLLALALLHPHSKADRLSSDVHFVMLCWTFSSKPLLPSCCFTFLSDKEQQYRRCSH